VAETAVADGPGPGLRGLVRELLRAVRRDNVAAYAGNLTYLGLLSLFPFFVFLLSLVGLLAARVDLLGEFIHRASATLPKEAVALLEGPVLRAAQKEGAAFRAGAIVSIGVAVVAMSGAMRGLMTALNAIQGVAESRKALRRFLTSVVLSLGVSLLLVGALALALAGDAVSTAMVHAGLLGRAVWDAWNLLQWPVLAGVGFLAFLLLYRFAPATASSWRSLRPGALLALVLWLAFSVGFSVYVNTVPSYNAMYGALAGVVILMLYMYYSALVLLVGAELNRVAARRRAEAA
jgi:membrane protein